MIHFADETTITVSSGNGGNGCVAFRREAHVPLGGPAGGDGGRGGDVVFEVRRNLRTLVHIRYAKHYRAQSGQDGMGRNKHGADGEDVIIPVPPGTVIKNAETGEALKDFGKSAEGRWVFLRGGNGGWGNVHFKSSVNQAPRNALPGKPGESVELHVELQLMADIGFVGFPNAGKSSLLDRFTNARPKIAPYPFTTKIPNLGVLTIADRDIILADIPGIIEGAHDGAGLGIRFLKHISRTAALAFLIDLSDDKFLDSFRVLLSELAGFSEELVSKPRIVIGTKLDLPETTGRLEELAAALPDERVVGISTFSGEGLESLSRDFLAFVLAAEKPGERDPWTGAAI
ncbi:MAG: GTPase ObgE [Spirochaetae bacterium HGW-Spirochaetae-3]|jgi:GTP-binding protein|nr:MAG: GTPase ObgE [Spirochaetae bacterium HGW-Spirochaetae-3]